MRRVRKRKRKSKRIVVEDAVGNLSLSGLRRLSKLVSSCAAKEKGRVLLDGPTHAVSYLRDALNSGKLCSAQPSLG